MSKTKKILLSVALLTIVACGTGIGNGFRDPTIPNPNYPIDNSIPSTSFLNAVNEYNQSSLVDCGRFTELSLPANIQDGRKCIKKADQTCTPSKYLLDKHNAAGSRFVSFVSVENDPNNLGCLVKVHTVSNVPGNILSEQRICEAFDEGQMPELTCGIWQLLD
ncbi:MAG: hypothetical protein IT286_04550 [Proteobacteria bacterium]|nr:hypothetical protein [Pseudomonadota bacterium]